MTPWASGVCRADAAVAADMVRAEVEGFRDKKMLLLCQALPGIGAAAGDSHEGAYHHRGDQRGVGNGPVPFRAGHRSGGAHAIMVDT